MAQESPEGDSGGVCNCLERSERSLNEDLKPSHVSAPEMSQSWQGSITAKWRLNSSMNWWWSEVSVKGVAPSKSGDGDQHLEVIELRNLFVQWNDDDGTTCIVHHARLRSRTP